MVPNERLAVMLPEPAFFSVQLKAVLQDSEIMITAQARLGDRAFTKQKLRVRARAARTVNCFDPGRFERFIRESRCSGEIAEFLRSKGGSRTRSLRVCNVFKLEGAAP